MFSFETQILEYIEDVCLHTVFGFDNATELAD